MRAEKLPSGRYRVRVELGKDSSGKRHRKSFTGTDKKKLLRIAAQYQDEHREYLESCTISAALDAYMREREPVLSPSTVRGYISIAKELKSVYGRFCALSVDSVNAHDMQDVINRLSRSKSPKTVSNYCGFILSALRQQGKTIDGIRLPERARSEKLVPDVGDVKIMLRESEGTELHIPILLAVTGTMRRGEICALELSDFTGDTVHVSKSMVYGADQRLTIKRPKTKDSDRYISLPPAVVEKIMEQGYVTKLTPGAMSEAFTSLCRRAGLPPYTFHSLRHYSASYMHSIGVPDQSIMSRGGWRTDHVMKSVYRHELESARNRENRRINAAFSDSMDL